MFGRDKRSDAPSAADLAPAAEELHFVLSTPEEAKQAIAEVKLKKKELQLQKRELNATLAQIRAARRSQVANQGSKMRGGGNLGKVVRAMQTAGRDADRRAYTERVNTVEQAKLKFDSAIAECDRVVLQIQQWLEEVKRDMRA